MKTEHKIKKITWSTGVGVKKILILATARAESKEKLTAYLKNYFDKKAVVSLGIFSDITYQIESGGVVIEIDGVDINTFDLIYFRKTSGFASFANALAIYLDHKKIKFYDDSFINGSYSGDKFTALMRLAVNNIPIVPSFLCWKGSIKKNREKIITKFGFPVVAKEVTTQRMQSIYLLKSKEDFEKLPDRTVKDLDARYLFQKFISIDREFRLLVLGSEVGIIHTKTVRDNTGFAVGYNDMNENPEFLNPDDTPNVIKNAAISAAKVLHIQIAGVDICREVTTGKVYVFEVNRGPGLEYDTNISQELPKIAEFFTKQLLLKSP